MLIVAISNEYVDLFVLLLNFDDLLALFIGHVWEQVIDINLGLEIFWLLCLTGSISWELRPSTALLFGQITSALIRSRRVISPKLIAHDRFLLGGYFADVEGRPTRSRVSSLSGRHGRSMTCIMESVVFLQSRGFELIHKPWAVL